MPQKILLIQLRQLGDIMLTTPCIRAVKEAYPDAQVSFLSHPMGALILKGNPWLDHLYTYDPKDKWQELKLISRLRQQSFDLVLDFMNNPRSAFYSLLVGKKERLSFSSSRRFAYTKTIERAKESDYIVREKFRLLRSAGIFPAKENLCLPWGNEHTAPLKELLAIESFQKAPLRVVLSPTHRRPVRQWQAQKFADLSDRLTRKWGAQILWIWGPQEKEFVEEIRALCAHETLICPQTGFRELAAVIANTDLFVGTSNGPSHVAVAVDTPSLQLHGPTQMDAWCPQSERHRAIQSALHLTDKEGSMAAITGEEVWQKLEAFRPYLEKKAKFRRENGDRMSWDAE